jgi:hypothetical protein
MLFEVSRLPPEEFILRLASDYARNAGSKNLSAAPSFNAAYRLASLDCQFVLLELVCHIHVTPIVRALATDLADYASSSYRAYCRMESVPWLTTRRVLSMLDRDMHRARKLLKQCVDARIARIRRQRERSAFTPTGNAAFFSKLTREPSWRSLLGVAALPSQRAIAEKGRKEGQMGASPDGWPDLEDLN